MATIDQVKKHYDQLTAPERFALIVAASMREDESERRELIHSAPRNTWRTPDYYGLSEGFEFAGSWYMMTQLGYIATMYFMFENCNKSSQGAKYFDVNFQGKETSISLDEYGDKVVKRILSNHLAWQRLCGEYKIDHEVMLTSYPHYDVMQMRLLIIDSAAGMMGPEAQPVEKEIEAELTDLRAVIEYHTKQWE